MLAESSAAWTGEEERRQQRWQHPGRALERWLSSLAAGRQLFLVVADARGLPVAASPMSDTRARMMAALSLDAARSRALPQRLVAFEVDGRRYTLALAGTRRDVDAVWQEANSGCQRILPQRWI